MDDSDVVDFFFLCVFDHVFIYLFIYSRRMFIISGNFCLIVHLHDNSLFNDEIIIR